MLIVKYDSAVSDIKYYISLLVGAWDGRDDWYVITNADISSGDDGVVAN